MDPTELVQLDGWRGARVEIGDATWEVFFHTQGALGGRIKHTGRGSLFRAHADDERGTAGGNPRPLTVARWNEVIAEWTVARK